ncbi:MAG: hypothetical protein H6849_00930 [Alphaproteobacteria bacterium]|nr:MAG: hypothetical protein H6849_00930 [Alphaproteobacteria bacterium]
MGALGMAAGEMDRMRHAAMAMSPARAMRYDVSLPSSSAMLASVAHRLSTPAGQAMHAIEVQARQERRLQEARAAAMARRTFESPDYAKAAAVPRVESDALHKSIRAASPPKDTKPVQGEPAAPSAVVRSLPPEAIQTVEDILAIGQDVHARTAARAGALVPGLSPIDAEHLQARIWRAVAVDAETGELVADASAGAEAPPLSEDAPRKPLGYLPDGDVESTMPALGAAVERGFGVAGRYVWDRIGEGSPLIPATVEALTDAHDYYRTHMLATYEEGPEAYMRAREADYNATEGEGAFAGLSQRDRGRLVSEWADDFNNLRPLGVVGTLVDGITHTAVAAGEGVHWVSHAGGVLLARGLLEAGVPAAMAQDVGYTVDVAGQWIIPWQAPRLVGAAAAGAGAVSRSVVRTGRSIMARGFARNLSRELAAQRLARTALMIEAQQGSQGLQALNLNLSTRAVNMNTHPLPPVFARAVGAETAAMGGAARAPVSGGEGTLMRATGGGGGPRPAAAASSARPAPATGAASGGGASARAGRAAGPTAPTSETLSSARAGDLATSGQTGISRRAVLAAHYVRDMERMSGVSFTTKQKSHLEHALRTQRFSRLAAAEKSTHTSKFGGLRESLISEWERETGNLWPTYRERVFSRRTGDVIGEIGERYQAHHIIPQQNGGPHKWWNMKPVRIDDHLGGLHGSGSALRMLQAIGAE